MASSTTDRNLWVEASQQISDAAHHYLAVLAITHLIDTDPDRLAGMIDEAVAVTK